MLRLGRAGRGVRQWEKDAWNVNKNAMENNHL